MKLKITKTLIESWQYIFDCFEGGEDEAMESFLKTLRREPLEPTEAMLNGTNFENLCYEMASDKNVVDEVYDGTVCPVNGEANYSISFPKWYTGAKKVAEIIRGGQFQVPVSCNLSVAGKDFWLYGICDVVKAGTIYDVKFKNKSLGSADVYGNYLNCSQHSIYLRSLPEASNFIYLVSDGEDLYTQEYNRKSSKPVEEYITNFYAWLMTNPDLLQIYNERWAVE